MVDQTIDKSTIIATILFILSGFFASFFFTGGTSIAYAPALICLIIPLTILWNKPLGLPLHTIFLGLFTLYAGLSFFWSTAPYISLVSFLVLLGLPLSYFLVRVILQRFPDNTPSIIHYSFIGIMLIFCLYGFWDFLRGEEPRLSSIFSNPNTFAAFLVLALLSCTGFLLYSSDKKRLLWTVLSALFLITIIFTGSRSGLITGFCTLFLLFLFSQTSRHRTVIAFLLGSFCILGAISYTLDFTFFTRLIDTFSTRYSDSTIGRLIIWEGSLNLAKEHLWLGTGIGTFFLNYPPYRLPFDPSAGDWAHMDSLQLLSETGLVGVSLWLGFWISLFVSLLKSYSTLPHTALIAVLCCLCLFIQGFITYLYLILPFLFVIGSMLALYDHNVTRSGLILTASSRWGRITFTLIAVLALQSGWSMFTTQSAKHHFQSAETAHAKQKLALVDLFGSPAFYEHYLALGRRGNMDAIKDAKSACPVCSDPYFVEGVLHQQSGNTTKAKTALWEALRRDPSTQHIRIRFVRILEQEKRYQEAAIIAKIGFNYPIDEETKTYFKNVISKHK